MDPLGRSLFERGYAHGTAGNLSVRLGAEAGGGYLITPTDACLGFLQPEALAQVGEDGVQIAGARASKTLALHRAIYAADPSARAVIHTHSRALVALSLQGAWRPDALLPPITPYQVMKVGRVPLIPYHRPGDPAAADAVVAAMAKAAAGGGPIRAVMLERLGPNVWAGSPAEAMATLEELEETAWLWLHCQPRPQPLDDPRIDELRRHFNARW
jgi:3-dehydro-4-phosphotetronate decarboxylase